MRRGEKRFRRSLNHLVLFAPTSLGHSPHSTYSSCNCNPFPGEKGKLTPIPPTAENFGGVSQSHPTYLQLSGPNSLQRNEKKTLRVRYNSHSRVRPITLILLTSVPPHPNGVVIEFFSFSRSQSLFTVPRAQKLCWHCCLRGLHIEGI